MIRSHAAKVLLVSFTLVYAPTVQAADAKIQLDSEPVSIGATAAFSRLSFGNRSSSDFNDAAGRLAVSENTTSGTYFYGMSLASQEISGTTHYGLGMWGGTGASTPWTGAHDCTSSECTGVQPDLFVEDTGEVGIGTMNPEQSLHVIGTALATVAHTTTSDARLKAAVTPLAQSLAKILSLKGVSFQWKAGPDTATHIGLTAQEVEKVFPEVVSTRKKTGIKSVAYGQLVAPLVEAIKEQQKQIDALKADVKSLKQQ